MHKLLLTVFLCALAALSPSAHAAPASGYWWNTVEPGRGFVIEIQGNQMFMAGFLYAATGEAAWVASFGQMTTSTQYSGPLVTFSGGQTLTGSFQSATQSSTPVGNIAINFTGDTTGAVTWPGGTFPIRRFDFGPGGSIAVPPLTNPETGWWWNPGEGGRGFAVEVQGGSMYLSGYMYDPTPTGNPLWYLANGNMTNTTAFQGTWTQFANGQTLTGAYRPPSVADSNVGLAQVVFTDNHTATMTLPNLRNIPLIRYAFGVPTPTLSSFSPASAAPGSTLTLSGVGFDPSGVFTVTLFDSKGSYSVTVPPSSVTPTAVNVSVPPFVNSFSGNFVAGTVNIKLTQKSNGVTQDTNTLSGFNIQQVPLVMSPSGAGTVSLVRASLAEAQRLQTSIQGTPQNTPTVSAALATQVANLQTLLTSVQNVVQKGISFVLGTVGGVTITVTPNNIGDVDQLILTTLQALANPGGGAAEKSAEAVGNSCMAAEAAAFAAALTSGSSNSNLDQLALNLVQAAGNSTACGTAAGFTSAYQILGGASGGGYGFANGAGTASISSRLPGVSLFASSVQTAQPQIGLNALTAPALSGQGATVQNAIVNVGTLATQTTNTFISKATGQLVTDIIGAQNLLNAAAPPPTGAANFNIAGTWSGTWTWIAGSNNCVFNDGGLVSMNITQNGVNVSGSNMSATGFEVHLVSDCSLEYVDSASGGSFTGTIAGNTLTYSASLPLVKFGSPFLWSGTATFNGTNNTLSGTIQAYGTTGSFTLVRR